jgi:hypothetical protein
MFSRRNFLKTSIATFLFPLKSIRLPVNTNKKVKYTHLIELNFENGDIQRIYIGPSLEQPNDGKTYYECLGNSMGHYSGNITTTYNFESVFKLGEIYTYDPDEKPEIVYKGLDKQGKIVYSGKVIEKIWKEYQGVHHA